MAALHLEYISEFDAYGIKKKIIADLAKKNEIADIILPEELEYTPDKFAPTIVFFARARQICNRRGILLCRQKLFASHDEHRC